MTQADTGSASDRPPQPEFLSKVEDAVQATLTLVPDVVRIVVQYTFTPARFIQRSLGSGRDLYRTPPYTFLTLTGFAITLGTSLTLALVDVLIEGLVNALTAWMGSESHEARVHLARQIENLQTRSLSTVLVTTAIIVIALASIARAFARATAKSATDRKFLERALCYVAAGQQVQMLFFLPAMALALLMSGSVITWVVVIPALLYCILWPTVAIAKTVRGVVPSRRRLVAIAFGAGFACLNPAVVALAWYASETVPATLTRWRRELLPKDTPRVVQLTYARGRIDENGELVITAAIELASGPPLIIDAERLSLSTASSFHSGWTIGVRLLDSSDGPVRLLVVRPQEIKWVQVAAPLSEELRQEALDGKWSSWLVLGDDTVFIADAPTDHVERLRSP